MAIPKVFVSSTCYDLKYIRENLKFFIHELGYDSVLSEEGDVFYDPKIHTHDACITEIPTCQVFVLIIGGRGGGRFKDSETSITNREYQEAVQQKIPIFTLIDDAVYKDHYLYTKNKDNPSVNANDIHYPSIDDIRIFDFIDEVRKAPTNNAVYTFHNYNDIEDYLKKQWAGMMYSFLTQQSESRRVGDLFEQIQAATDKIEFYTRQTVQVVGDEKTKVLVKIYDEIVNSEISNDLKIWGFRITPMLIISHDTLDSLCEGEIIVEEEEGDSIAYGGPPYLVGEERYESMNSEYTLLRCTLCGIMDKHNLSVNDLLTPEEAEIGDPSGA